jgi:hypothetical protein
VTKIPLPTKEVKLAVLIPLELRYPGLLRPMTVEEKAEEGRSCSRGLRQNLETDQRLNHRLVILSWRV